ncbi:unnamed protein product, partial [Musa acuminata subsp. burmannicoides]
VHLLHRTVFLCFWSSQDLLPHSGSNCCLLESGGGDDDDDLRCGIDRQDSRRGCGVGSQESAFLGTPGRARRWAGNRVYEGGGVRCNSWVVFAPWKVDDFGTVVSAEALKRPLEDLTSAVRT